MNYSNFGFDAFDIPDARIARYPADTRSNSRLLGVSVGKQGDLTDHYFYQLPDLLRPGDLLIINNSKVIPARLMLDKPTGGRVELLFERALQGGQALALLRSNKPLSSGILLGHRSGAFCVEVADRYKNALRKVTLQTSGIANWHSILSTYGEIPLPPYMRRKAEQIDTYRYQTCYASKDGSIAAPTAGLHFDANLFSRLKQRGIGVTELTLHVGYGTFAKVEADTTSLHAESFTISQECIEAIKAAKAQGGRVIAVGTTSVRAIESVALQGAIKPQQGETKLCIKPGFKFKIIDGMITNFHLPQTSLLWLVCALAGEANIAAAYHHALKGEYRFYSYGDAMLII